MDTEVAGIAGQLAAVEEAETPFQAEVERLVRRIGLGVVALIVVVAAAKLLSTAPDSVTVALAPDTLAVAAVLEGLQLAVLYTPLSGLFAVVPLGLAAWGWIAAGFVAFLALNLAMVRVLDRAFDGR